MYGWMDGWMVNKSMEPINLMWCEAHWLDMDKNRTIDHDDHVSCISSLALFGLPKDMYRTTVNMVILKFHFTLHHV